MDLNSFLTNEAVSNYIVFVAGILIGFLVFVFKELSRTPSIVELEKSKEMVLMEISDDAKSRLSITYEGEIVDSFHQTVFLLRNKTGKTIEDIKLKLYIDNSVRPQKIYEIIIDDPLENLRTPKPEVNCLVENDNRHYLLIIVPYLNDFRNENDVLTVKVYSPEPINVDKLIGGGKGWMSKFLDRVEFNNRIEGIAKESKSSTEFARKLLGIPF